jgi:hypothetical protein
VGIYRSIDWLGGAPVGNFNVGRLSAPAHSAGNPNCHHAAGTQSLPRPFRRVIMIERPDPNDYSVAMKRNRGPRNSWPWEINRPGKSIPVKQSVDHFDTMAEATRAGKEALQRLVKLRINLFVRER